MSHQTKLASVVAALLVTGASASAQNLSNVSINTVHISGDLGQKLCSPKSETPCTAQLLQSLLRNPNINLKITVQAKPDARLNCYGFPCL